MEKLTKKHKTHSITITHRGMELELICVTTSKKKFAELCDIPISFVNNYGYSYDLRYPICNENPDKLYAKPGMGGEIRYFTEKDEIKPFEEYINLINEHREKYTSYRDYLEKTNQK
jgi:hypothetical protein